jgi:hypothetical protein
MKCKILVKIKKLLSGTDRSFFDNNDFINIICELKIINEIDDRFKGNPWRKVLEKMTMAVFFLIFDRPGLICDKDNIVA